MHKILIFYSMIGIITYNLEGVFRFYEENDLKKKRTIDESEIKPMTQKQQLLQTITRYLTTYGDDLFFGEELSILQARLQSLESSIAVVGQFSVGKSALLNALLGQELLATRKVESTKILTRIRSCEKATDAKVVLTFKDGTNKTLPLQNVQELQKYTTFQGDDITDTLDYVDLYWPVHFLNKELVLIDTPGANSLTISAFQTTKNQLKTSSAIIYLFMGTKGLDQEDYSIISEYVEQKKKIFLVGTHIDQLTTEQWHEVKEEVYKKLPNKPELKQLDIVGVSSVDGLEGKKTQNKQLLQQSNLPQLEQLLHTYMATKEYERAEIRSIEHDLLLVQQEISQFEKEQQADAAAIEEDRARRFERLKVLTELDYAEVEEYGLALINQRTSEVEQLSHTYENQLLENGQAIFKKVRSQFTSFQQYIQKQMTTMPEVEQLKRAYADHLNQVEAIYNQWDQTFNKEAQGFSQALATQVLKQDNDFISMLKKLDKNVKISWDDFEQIMKKIKLKKIALAQDTKDFQHYEAKLEGNVSQYQDIQKQLIEKIRDKEAIQAEKKMREQRLTQEQQTAQRQLGTKPEPKARYREKGFWIFKSEEFVGYDYSEQERWDEKMKQLQIDYRKKQQQAEKDYAARLNNHTRTVAQIEQKLEALDAAEHEYNIELLGALYTTVSNQAETVKQLHQSRVNEMKNEWQLVVLLQQEQYERHLAAIEDSYKQFVRQSKKQAIDKLQVI